MMKRSFSRHILAFAAVAAITVTASAQSITESVTVEGRYTPDIIPADRLALLPAPISLSAPESPMSYDRRGVTAAFAPDALSMPATGWRSTKAYDTSRGYVDLWLGSWLNSSLSAGIAAIRKDDTRLNVYLQHNSTSLWQAWKGDEGKKIHAADYRIRYDETIGADMRHHVGGAGILTAGVQYHLGYFNYYTTATQSLVDDHEKAPTQTLNDIHASVGWVGERHNRLTYSADADVRYFAYRSMYLPLVEGFPPYRLIQTQGERETAVNIGGDIKYSLDDSSGNGSAIGTGLRYSGVLNSIGNNVNRVEATPGYKLTGRDYSVRFGVNLAVVDNGSKTRFRIAPDVTFSIRKGFTAFSASIGGGTHLRTLAWMHQMDYYSNPGIGCHEAAYSPIDASLALQLNPGGRWTFGLEGKWTTTLDETFGGLYQALLNNNLATIGVYPVSGRIHGFSVAVNAGYEFCRYLALKGKGSWQPQKGSTGILNGFDRPEFTAVLSAESSPIDRLSLKLDYRLRAKRLLLPGNMSRLDLSADYRITDRISVGVELGNLMNRHEEFLPGLPMEGFNAMGGVQIVF
ncbi:MAG: hypothetical protein K2N48_01925 [Muribaculaceae bacterium]|nr:hypothetical protein [Muribaculaceae bacterium]